MRRGLVVTMSTMLLVLDKVPYHPTPSVRPVRFSVSAADPVNCDRTGKAPRQEIGGIWSFHWS